MATIEQLEQRVLALEQRLTGGILDDDPYQSTHDGPEIDEAVDRALPGGGIDQGIAAIGQKIKEREPAIESVDYPGCYYRTVDGVTEWINPPMVAGVEFRTVERYQGKPVYKKLVDCGNLPNNTTKIVAYTDVENCNALSVSGVVANASTIPTTYFWATEGQTIDVQGVGSNINIVTNFDASAYPAKVTVRYTKPTD